jgi:hypothetical protein
LQEYFIRILVVTGAFLSFMDLHKDMFVPSSLDTCVEKGSCHCIAGNNKENSSEYFVFSIVMHDVGTSASFAVHHSPVGSDTVFHYYRFSHADMKHVSVVPDLV